MDPIPSNTVIIVERITCEGLGKVQVSEPHLQLLVDQRHPRGGAFLVWRFSERQSHLITAMQGDWKPLLQVTVRGDAPAMEDLPAVAGCFVVRPGELHFKPTLPFEPGRVYRAHLSPLLSARPYVDFAVPKEGTKDAPGVSRVYPTAHNLPENLLRFHVIFRTPMRRGQALDGIRLVAADGTVVEDALYRAPVELWDASMRQLTVWLDPGRMKRFVGPHAQLGPPLQAGRSYALDIGPKLVDNDGRPVPGTYTKRFVATAPVRTEVDVSAWQLDAPQAGSTHPLRISFGRFLDWISVPHAIRLFDARGLEVRGRFEMAEDEQHGLFQPVDPWQEGRLELRIDKTLEDVCGNSVVAPFDRPLRPLMDPERDARVWSRTVFPKSADEARNSLNVEPSSTCPESDNKGGWHEQVVDMHFGGGCSRW